jgi:hypothetical protein
MPAKQASKPYVNDDPPKDPTLGSSIHPFIHPSASLNHGAPSHQTGNQKGQINVVLLISLCLSISRSKNPSDPKTPALSRGIQARLQKSKKGALQSTSSIFTPDPWFGGVPMPTHSVPRVDGCAYHIFPSPTSLPFPRLLHPSTKPFHLPSPYQITIHPPSHPALLYLFFLNLSFNRSRKPPLFSPPLPLLLEAVFLRPK